MKRIILPLLLILFLVGGFALWRNRPVSSAMRLNLTGTPGLKVAGIVEADGVSQEFRGVLPISITVKARSFTYTIRMQAPRGELTGELVVSDGIYGSSSAANDFSGVRGSYSQSWFSKGGMMTTVGKAD